MDPLSCRSIRDLIVAYLGAHIEVTTAENHCIVSLPISTVDDRLVDVYVRQTMADYVVVSDGGKSMSELYAQGIHLTESQETTMKAIARQFGATFIGNVFQIGCKVPDVERSVMAIAQCASMAMFPVLSHKPNIEDEPVAARVARSLNAWKPDYVDIKRRQSIRGHHATHIFDFVSHARRRDANSVAIKLLPPSFGPHIQVQRYGFLTYDIAGRLGSEWQRLAIVSKREEWSNADLEVVRQLSDDVIELETDSEDRLEAILPGKMTELTMVA